VGCRGKLLDCVRDSMVYQGLKCVLSGNPAPGSVTAWSRHKGKPPIWQQMGDLRGKPAGPMSQRLLDKLPFALFVIDYGGW
jgi:hypothetical protein